MDYGISPGNKGFVTERRAYKQQHRGDLGINYHLVKLLYPVTLLPLQCDDVAPPWSGVPPLI
jgi:hypothetical protein